MLTTATEIDPNFLFDVAVLAAHIIAYVIQFNRG